MVRPLLEGLVLKDGTEVSDSGGAARWTDETEEGRWASDFYWKLPLDLSQVVGVRFGDTVIPSNCMKTYACLLTGVRFCAIL